MGNTKLFKYKKLKDTKKDSFDKSPTHTCFDLMFKKRSKTTKSYTSLQSDIIENLNNKNPVLVKNEMNIVNNLKSVYNHTPITTFGTKIDTNDHPNSKLYKFVKKLLKRKLKYSSKQLLSENNNNLQDSSPLWYHEHLSRTTTTKILQSRPSGSFIIRRSTKRSCYALSLSVINTSNFSSNKMKVLHFLIQEANNGFRIKGSSKVFQTLNALVIHHSVMAETLPVTLLLPKSDDVKEYYVRRINRKVEDYDSFEQLRKVLDELRIAT